MGDVITRLGVDYQDAGSKAFIADAQVMATEGANVTRAMKESGVAAAEAAPFWQQMALQMVAQDVPAQQIVKTLTQWGLAEQEVTQFLRQHGVALQEDTQETIANIEATDANAEAHKRLGGNILSTGGILREGRLLMMAMTAEMALMTLTAGEKLPEGLQQTAKGLQEVTQFAMMGFIALGPWGAALGAVAGGILAVATAANQSSPEVQALNKELEKFGHQDDAARGLAELTGLTLADAEAALKAAKNNSDLADAIIKAKDAEEAAQKVMPHARGETLEQYEQRTAKIREERQATADLAEAQLNAALAAEAVAKSHERVISTLTTDAEKSNAAQLADLARVSQDTAKEFLNYASTHEDVAKRAAALATEIDREEQALARLQSTGKGTASDIQAMTRFIDEQTDALQRLIGATQRVSIAEAMIPISAKMQETEHQMSVLAQDTTVKLEEFAAQEVKDRENAEAQKVRAAQNADQQIARLAQSLADELASIDQQRVNAAEQNADQVARANRSLNEALARDAQQLSDRLADINQSLADKEADAWRQYQEKLRTLGDDLARQRQDLADKIRDIDRKLAEDLAAFDFNTHEQMLGAKTDHDRADIERRAVFERAQIEQRASDEKSTAERRFAEEQALSEEKKRLAREEYEYRISLAEREAAQQRSQAERTYREQVAQAQQRNRDELADLQERLNDENRRLDQQAARARERNAQEVANVQARLKTEIADINTRYEAEIKAIEVARDAFLRAEREKEAALNVTIAQLQYQILLLTNAAMVFEQENPEVRRGGGVVPTHQLGGMVEGPLGAPKLVMAHGGEEIIPVGARGASVKESSPQWVNITAEPLVAPVVEKMIAQMFQSGLFREGVRVAINDGMFQ